MKKVAFLVFIIFFTIPFLTSDLQVDASPPPDKNWELIFSDEFHDTSIDLSKWTPNWWGSSNTSITPPVNALGRSCHDPALASVSNGILNLSIKAVTPSANCLLKDGTYAKFASGMVGSLKKFDFVYGYSEARIWTPAGAGIWASFWINGYNWPEDGEIDILEAYGTDRSTYHYHYGGCDGNCSDGGATIVPGATQGWHTYAAHWEPNKITWYYDGDQVWQYDTGITSAPHYIMLNLGLNSDQASVPATMKVDYVRVYQEKISTCPADFNNDKQINISDLNIFAQNYKKQNISCSLDLVGDNCYLDIADLNEFAKVYKVENACD